MVSRVGRRRRARLASELSERDQLVLSRIWEHRYLTTLQVQRFCFTGHASDESAARTTRRVLARLQRDQLIRPLTRRIGGVRAGSEARVWQLAPAGARIALPDTGKTWRAHEPSERFLAHTLAVADVHLCLRTGLTHGLDVSVQIEPLSWRRFSGIGGEARLVRPDLAAALQGADHQGSYEDRWFVEVDMGTESIPTLLTKCRLYMDYYRSGIEQDSHGSFPRALWVMHGPRARQRGETLTRRILRTPSLEPRLFKITTREDLPGVLWGSPVTNPERKEVI
ncbi:hypothetical protein BW730_06965 [Tessaracoccus aquimaris]|uniref:Replication-relaxation n=1 Tax=Tessaracoccus aquimaris TaxID=1332264 RepID=A0A1Q2CME6_9ACTN|nr:hypothetical protein BW730_06965 [Tessaracoccus aquimaris]